MSKTHGEREGQALPASALTQVRQGLVSERQRLWSYFGDSRPALSERL